MCLIPQPSTVLFRLGMCPTTDQTRGPGLHPSLYSLRFNSYFNIGVHSVLRSFVCLSFDLLQLYGDLRPRSSFVDSDVNLLNSLVTLRSVPNPPPPTSVFFHSGYRLGESLCRPQRELLFDKVHFPYPGDFRRTGHKLSCHHFPYFDDP